MKFKLLVALIVLGAGALVATKPSEADVEQLLHARLQEEVDKGAGLDPNDPMQQILLNLCKSGGSGCIKLLRQLIKTEYEGGVFYANVSAKLPGGKSMNCVAVLNGVQCPDFLQD